jgi:hypothetical protein
MATVLPLVQAFHQVENLPITEKEISLATLLRNDSLGGIQLIYYQSQSVGYIMLCFGYGVELSRKDAFVDDFGIVH